MPRQTDLIQGTLDLLILRTLALEPMHGYGISKRLHQISKGVLEIKPGTFFPALYRLADEGLIAGDWGLSENKRRARFYRLTRSGRKQLTAETAQWERSALAINRVLEAT